MPDRLSADGIEELLGAYALDAIDDDERAQIEEFLARSPRAAAEVREMQKAAAFLADGGREAPADLWPRIAQALEEEPPPFVFQLPAVEVSGPSPVWRLDTRRQRIVLSGIAAAAVLVTGFLGAKVLQQQDRIDDVAGQLQGRDGVTRLAASAGDTPGARTVTLASEGGQFEADVVYLRRGQGYLVTDNLERLPADRTYQLWVLVGDRNAPTPISAAVLGPDPTTTAFTVRGEVVGFMITDEPMPGVPRPTSPPLLQGGVV